MNCEEVKKRIELHVLGESNVAEGLEIEAHLTDCCECSAMDAEYRALVADLKQSAAVRPGDAEFERKLLLSLEHQIGKTTPHAPARRTIRLGWAAMAAAACLLVGLIVQQLWVHLGLYATSGSVESAGAIQSSIPSYSIAADARAAPASPADNIAVRGHYIYALLDDGLGANVAAIDSLTGRQKWRSDVESFGHITVDQTHLFCLAPGENGGLDLVGVDLVDGRTTWRYRGKTSEPLHGMCTPIVLPGERLCWTTDATIHMLSSTDGGLLWKRTIGGENLLSAAAAVGGDLYVAGIRGLYCLDVASGAPLWESRYDFRVSPWARPLVAASDGEICAGLRTPRGRSKLFCMSLTDGRTTWTKTIWPVSHLCMAGHRLFVRGQGVQALDATNGRSLWSFASEGCSPLTCADGRIWFVDSTDRGHLVALYEQTGRKTLDVTGIRSCNAFIAMDGKGYVKTQDGAIHVVLLNG
jgi:outer membrane protein assembly factor BamB